MTQLVTWARLVLAVACLLCGLAVARADTGAVDRAESKIALIIGNSDYAMKGWGLDTPARDAADIANTLSQVGFVVTVKTNVDQGTFTKALNKFSHDAENADVALFYFAGHGIQFQGENYFLPVDAQPTDNTDMTFQSIQMGTVVRATSRAHKTKIIILDACRNSVPDPTRAGKSRAATGHLGDYSGLAQIDSSPGMIIFYSAQHGSTAADSGINGVNSPFAQSLLAHVPEAGREIRDVFGEVAKDVKADTDGKQVPETIASLTDNVFLNPAETDEDIWKRIKNTTDVQTFLKFTKDYPESDFVYAAQNKIRVLTEGVCRRDHDALGKLQVAKDVEGLRKLKSSAVCPSTPADADAALAAVEGQNRCDADQRALDAADQRNLDALTAVKGGIKCDKIIADAANRIARLKEAAQQACLDERAGIDVYARGAREKLTAFRDKASCVTLRVDVDHDIVALDGRVGAAQRELARLGCFTPKPGGPFDDATQASLATYLRARKSAAPPNRVDDALLADLRGQAPGICAPPPPTAEQIAQACARDQDAIRKLESASDFAGLRAFGTDSICKASRSNAEASRQRVQVCVNDQQRFDKIDKTSLSAVMAVKGQFSCDKVAQQAEALSVALAEQARQKVCKDERADFERVDLKAPDGRDRLTSLKIECPSLRGDVDAAVKALDDRIGEAQRDLGALGCLTSPPSGRFDRDTVAALNAYRTASHVSAREPRIDDDLLAEMRGQHGRVCVPVDVAGVCARDEAEIARRENTGNVADLQAFVTDANCPTSRAKLDEAVKRAQICVADQKRFDAVDKASLAALAAVKTAVKCERVQQQVADATVKQEAVAKQNEEARRQVCEAEGAKVAAIDVYAPEGRQQLSALSGAVSCPSARADIASGIKALDDRVARAQRDLASVGCLKSAPTGKFDEATTAALTAYEDARHLSVGAPRLDLSTLDELDAQHLPICLPPPPPPASIASVCQGVFKELEILEDNENSQAMRSLGSASRCPTANEAVSGAIARVERCAVERRDFAQIDQTSLPAVKAFQQSVTCYKVTQAVSVVAGKLEAETESRKLACDKEAEEIKKTDVGAREDRLSSLLQASACPALDVEIANKIAERKVLIMRAQEALAQRKCFSSPTSGEFDAATSDALVKFALAYNVRVEVTSITEGLLTRINAEAPRDCVPEAPATTTATRPPEVKPPAVTVSRPPEVKTPPVVASRPAPAPMKIQPKPTVSAPPPTPQEKAVTIRPKKTVTPRTPATDVAGGERPRHSGPAPEASPKASFSPSSPKMDINISTY